MQSERTDAWRIDAILDDVIEIACERLSSKRNAFGTCNALGELLHVKFACKRYGEH